ncbi:MAG: hypothetical protein K2O41_05490 [Clostridia bacterium]|nr:hypothetical protein [Clostridia bacterium]
MKKLFATLLAVCSVIAVCAFAGCKDGNENVKRTQIDDQTSVIFTASNDVLTLDENTTVKDYLDALKAKGELSFEGSDSDYGFFLTSFDGKENQVISTSPYEGYSWMIYIDFTTLDGTIYATDYSVCEYEGKTLYSASYGVSGIPCVEGHTYAFVYEYYKY